MHMHAHACTCIHTYIYTYSYVLLHSYVLHYLPGLTFHRMPGTTRYGPVTAQERALILADHAVSVHVRISTFSGAERNESSFS